MLWIQIQIEEIRNAVRLLDYSLREECSTIEIQGQCNNWKTQQKQIHLEFKLENRIWKEFVKELDEPIEEG